MATEAVDARLTPPTYSARLPEAAAFSLLYGKDPWSQIILVKTLLGMRADADARSKSTHVVDAIDAVIAWFVEEYPDCMNPTPSTDQVSGSYFDGDYEPDPRIVEAMKLRGLLPKPEQVA